jgi:hypothetical protein
VFVFSVRQGLQLLAVVVVIWVVEDVEWGRCWLSKGHGLVEITHFKGSFVADLLLWVLGKVHVVTPLAPPARFYHVLLITY